MPTFHFTEQPESVALFLRMSFEGALNDIAELTAFLKATDTELETAGANRDKFNKKQWTPANQRDGALLFLHAGRQLSEKYLNEFEDWNLQALCLAALVAEGAVLKAAGSCLGLQLGQAADSKLLNIRRGASKGGKKGAETRRANSSLPAPATLRVEAQKLAATAERGRNAATILAKKYGRDVSNIRRHLKKA